MICSLEHVLAVVACAGGDSNFNSEIVTGQDAVRWMGRASLDELDNLECCCLHAQLSASMPPPLCCLHAPHSFPPSCRPQAT